MTWLLNITNSQWNVWLNVTMLVAVVVIGIVGLRYMKEYTGIRRYVEIWAMIKSMEVSPKAIIVTDADGLIIFWNKGAENVLGYKAAKIKGQPVTKVIAEAHREVITKGLALLREGEDAGMIGKGPLETVCIHALGEEFPAEITIWKYVDDNDTFFAGLIRNTTRQKAAAAVAAAVIDLYEKGEKLADEGMWVWDTVKDNLHVSEGMKRIYGLDVYDAPAKHIRSKVFHQDAPKVSAALTKLRETKKGYKDLEYRVALSDGSCNLVSSKTQTELNEDGEIVRIYGVIKFIKHIV